MITALNTNWVRKVNLDRHLLRLKEHPEKGDNYNNKIRIVIINRIKVVQHNSVIFSKIIGQNVISEMK